MNWNGPWLGQVPIRGLGQPRRRLGQLNCCTEAGPGGGQVQKCFDTGTGECVMTWVSPEGTYPGVPACVNGLPPGCPQPGAAAPPPPEPQPGPPPPSPFCPEGQILYGGACVPADQALGPTAPLAPTPSPAPPSPEPAPAPIPTAPIEAPAPVFPTQPVTIPTMPTGAFPGAPYAPVPRMAPAAARAPIAPPPPPRPLPCPIGPIAVEDWTKRCVGHALEQLGW